MPDFRRGAAPIEEAASSKGGNGFRPFVPKIEWRDDKEEKYILFLTPVEEIPTVDYHEWIPTGQGEKANGDTYVKYDQFISRKDPAIGESYDELEDRLDAKPKARSIAVAVELEPIMETVKGREKAVGFKVATDTYTRKTDNDGEEEVTQPAVGLVIQAAQNFFGWLSSYDASQGPIEETPMHVVRRGKDANTTYDFIALDGREIDLAPLLDFIDGVSYLNDEMDDIIAGLDAAESFEDAASLIANILLDKRLTELADKERYDELVGPIEKIESKFGKKKGNAKKERPPRPSRRQAKDTSEAAAEAPPEDTPAEEPAEAPATKTDRFAALRAKIDAKNTANAA